MGWLKTLFAAIWHIFKPVAQQAILDFEKKVEQLGEEGIILVQDAITYAAALGLKDTAARDAAIAKLLSDVGGDALDLASWAKSELNALIELVYVGMKPVVSVPPAA